MISKNFVFRQGSAACKSPQPVLLSGPKRTGEQYHISWQQTACANPASAERWKGDTRTGVRRVNGVIPWQAVAQTTSQSSSEEPLGDSSLTSGQISSCFLVVTGINRVRSGTRHRAI